MNVNTPENYDQDDKNFQNANTDNQKQNKRSSSTDHPFTDNAEPDYGNDLSTEEISKESDHKNLAGSGQQDPRNSDSHSNPYDSENLDNESDSDQKDITEQDIEEDLRNHDPSEGFETEIDQFETSESDSDNPVNKEFEIGELGNEELKEDELSRDETASGLHHNKPSQRKF